MSHYVVIILTLDNKIARSTNSAHSAKRSVLFAFGFGPKISRELPSSQVGFNSRY